MSILEDMGAHLISNSIVDGATGWALYYGYVPASPDQIVALHETGGLEPDQTVPAASSYPTFQVVVRGGKLDYATTRTQIQAFVDSLNNATIAGYTYIYPTDSGPIPLRHDREDERPEMVWNFRAMKD